MNLLYQYYNEIVLVFREYYIDFENGKIVIEVPESSKNFELVCERIMEQLQRISETLEPRDQDITIEIRRNLEKSTLMLEKQA